MTDKLREAHETVAIALWREEAASTPSVQKGRTAEAWDDQAPELRDKWRRFARAALAAAPQPAPDREALVEVLRRHFLESVYVSPEGIADALLARGLRLPGGEALSNAARDVLSERQRQISVEGYTPEQDDRRHRSYLALAAASYAIQSSLLDCNETPSGQVDPPSCWPGPRESWKPSNERRNLVKAGALILAEIESLDRLAIRVVEGGDDAA